LEVVGGTYAAAVVETVAAEETAPRASRRRRPSVYVIAPLAFVLMLLVARVVYWRVSIAYAPLQTAGFGGPVAGLPEHLTPGPQLHLVGPTGTEQILEFAVVNRGDHPLDIKSVTPTDPAVINVRWAANRTVAENPAGGLPAPSHDFPVHLVAHATVKIQFVVSKPDCSAFRAGGSRFLSGEVRIRWHAMMSSHVTDMDILDDGTAPFLTLCGE
jgi:hypothetical protein